MNDAVEASRRSKNMSRIRAKDTAPEMTVRRLLHSLGYRYRLHARELPGKPDIVFRRKRKVIFVHGCFWHLHEDCREGRIPATRPEYWKPKLIRNRERDADHLAALAAAGWLVFVIWECQVTHTALLKTRLQQFLA